MESSTTIDSFDTLRILPPAPSDEANGDGEPALGVEQGGIQSAEALMLARYFMYSQVYFHHIRRIYDIHLKDFLQAWLPTGSFSTDVGDHLAMTDNEVTAGFLEAALDSSKRGHDSAQKIVQRQHFKVLYERNPADVAIIPEAGQAIYEGLCAEFGDEYFRHDRYRQKSGAPDFPVRMRDDQIVSSLAISEALHTLPVVSVDFVFAERTMYADADKWLKQRHDQIIQPKPEEEANG